MRDEYDFEKLTVIKNPYTKDTGKMCRITIKRDTTDLSLSINGNESEDELNELKVNLDKNIKAYYEVHRAVDDKWVKGKPKAATVIDRDNSILIVYENGESWLYLNDVNRAGND